MSIIDVTEKYVEFVAAGKNREAAEFAYALTVLHHRAGSRELAELYRDRALEFIAQCPSDTYYDCAETHRIIEGVCTPDLMHLEVVRHRFKLMGLL